MTLDDWNTLFQFLSVVLLALTFAVGSGAVITGYFLGKRQTERIATAGRDAAEAYRGAAEANALAKASEEKIAVLNVEAASLRERAATAERELFVVKERTTPRSLTQEQADSILDAIAPLPATITLTKLGDAEARMYGDQIERVIRAAGWTIHGLFVGSLSPPRYGLFVYTGAGALSPPIAALVAAFNKAGVQVSVTRPPQGMFIGSAHVFIGLRPVR